MWCCPPGHHHPLAVYQGLDHYGILSALISPSEVFNASEIDPMRIQLKILHEYLHLLASRTSV
jgi:hypothetical protein